MKIRNTICVCEKYDWLDLKYSWSPKRASDGEIQIGGSYSRVVMLEAKKTLDTSLDWCKCISVGAIYLSRPKHKKVD